MRILAVYYTHKPGGFCKRLYRLLNALVARGAEVHYLTLDQPPPALNSAIQIHLIPFPLRARRGLLFWGMFTAWCRVYIFWKALWIRPERYAIFGAYYAAACRLARFGAPGKLVLFVRSLVFESDRISGKPTWLRFFTERVERRGLRSAQRTVCMTRAMQVVLSDFLGHPLLSPEILPNDVPQRVKRRFNDNSQVITALTSGTLDPGKNVGLILEALALLDPEKQRKIRLIVAGDGVLKPTLEERAAQLGLNNVQFVGWQDSLENLHQTVDLVVHPSLREGMPNAILEALGYGLPILASNIPELAELLQYPELLFDSDNAEALAIKLACILSDPQHLPAMRRLSQQRAEQLSFNWDHLAAGMVLAP